VLLKAGQRLTITPREVPGTASLVGTTFKTLAENVEQGSRILLSDGLIELRVHEVDRTATWSARSSTAACWAKTRASTCRHSGARALADRKGRRGP
jgi:pyruvate kinase